MDISNHECQNLGFNPLFVLQPQHFGEYGFYYAASQFGGALIAEMPVPSCCNLDRKVRDRPKRCAGWLETLTAIPPYTRTDAPMRPYPVFLDVVSELPRYKISEEARKGWAKMKPVIHSRGMTGASPYSPRQRNAIPISPRGPSKQKSGQLYGSAAAIYAI